MAAPSRDLLDRIAACLAVRPEVLDGYLFGSHARGTAQPHSDIDVAVYVAPAALPAGGGDVDAAIAADLMSALARNDVDVILLNHAPPLLYHRVLRDGVRAFSRDPRATTTREGQALSRYCDFVPQLAKIRTASERRLRAGAFGR